VPAWLPSAGYSGAFESDENEGIHELGCNYTFIIDENSTDDIGLFDLIHPIGQRRTKGQFSPRIIKLDGKPVLQMILMEYRGNKDFDILVGWEIGGRDNIDFPIMLIKTTTNAPAWKFFTLLFDEYNRQSRPFTKELVVR
jgi:hypothetical protein